MQGYVIIDSEVVDAQRLPEFVQKVSEAVAAHGGRFLVRGGQLEAIHGDWAPQRLVVIEFDSFDRAREFAASAEYAAVDKVREQAITSNVVMVEGIAAD
ncbi:DUF1330 domain-containing protein [Candidatus Poriferisodalis multihospitum]|uniref:DUF1330 domain-containing protein n=1 Tax=Candidatus Poriferisodalis multihospitum TaxID=2983191 RepID=UPI002B260CE9|nr:DUF1330 domain-containing protein [Candidatus Poriferisodalis multihospitum]